MGESKENLEHFVSVSEQKSRFQVVFDRFRQYYILFTLRNFDKSLNKTLSFLRYEIYSLILSRVTGADH